MPLTPISNASLWIGRTLSAFVILFLLFDAGIKLIPLDIVIETMKKMGIPVELTSTLGVLTLICTVLYAIPQTSVLGAVLLTGYLGGAMYAQILAHSPLFSHTLFGSYLGLMIWGGLYLRDERVRAIFPWRN